MRARQGGRGDAEQHPGDAGRVRLLQPRGSGRGGRHGERAQVSGGQGPGGAVQLHPLSQDVGGDRNAQTQLAASDAIAMLPMMIGARETCLPRVPI